MEHRLSLGTSKINITPKKAVQLAGFASRESKLFDGVEEQIYARIFYFEQTDSAEKALIVSADILFWGQERIDFLRKEINQKWGIAEKAIILHATHSHSGPATTNRLIDIGYPDHEYLHDLEKKLLKGIQMAIANAEEVKIETAKGSCDLGVNRRKEVNGKYINSPNSNGIKDSEVQLIKFSNMSNKTKAILVNYACHPTSTDRNYITSEYCGIAAELVEHEFLESGTIVGFLQGCCGDINPISRGKNLSGNEAIQYNGRKFADVILNILTGPFERQSVCKIHSEQTTVDLLFQKVPTIEKLQEIARCTNSNTMRKWAKMLIEDPNRLTNSIPLEFTKLQICDEVVFVAMNAEMVTEYGLYIKKQLNGVVIPMGYSNGIIGYVTTAKQLEEGGYEPIDSSIYFGLPSPFHFVNEENIRKHILNRL